MPVMYFSMSRSERCSDIRMDRRAKPIVDQRVTVFVAAHIRAHIYPQKVIYPVSRTGEKGKLAYRSLVVVLILL
jgi:hypothetical protein